MVLVVAILNRLIDGREDAVDKFVDFEDVVEPEASDVGAGRIAHFEVDAERGWEDLFAR